MSYQFYLVLHIVSLFVVVLTLGSLWGYIFSGGHKANFPLRKSTAMLHGLFLLVVFISGFGLMAKAQYSFSSSPWLYGKILCWMIIGAYPTLIYKKVLPQWANLLTLILVLMAAAVLAIFKPF